MMCSDDEENAEGRGLPLQDDHEQAPPQRAGVAERCARDILKSSYRRATNCFEVLADDEVQMLDEVHPARAEQKAPAVDLTAPEDGWARVTKRRAPRK